MNVFVSHSEINLKRRVNQIWSCPSLIISTYKHGANLSLSLPVILNQLVKKSFICRAVNIHTELPPLSLSWDRSYGDCHRRIFPIILWCNCNSWELQTHFINGICIISKIVIVEMTYMDCFRLKTCHLLPIKLCTFVYIASELSAFLSWEDKFRRVSWAQQTVNSDN